MVASPMPPEPPAPNLDSPRVQAAMDVLGLKPKDLEKREPSAFEGVGYEVFERRRRRLLQNLVDMAAASPEVKPGTQLGGSGNISFMDEVMRAEAANIERMRRMAKKQVESLVVKELETKVLSKEAQEAQEASEARQKEIKKARKEQLKEAQKQAQKKLQRAVEGRQKAEAQQKREAERILERMKETSEKVEARVADIVETRKEERARNEERRAGIADRVAGLGRDDWRRREDFHQTLVDKHRYKTELLSRSFEGTQRKRDELAGKLEHAVEVAYEKRSKAQAEREAAFHTTVSRHEKSTQAREKLAEDEAKKIRVRNTKATNDHRGRYERVLKEIEKIPPSRRLTQSCSEPLMRKASPELVRAQDHNRAMYEACSANKSQLSEAHSYHQAQILTKIDNVRDRVQFIHDKRKQAAQRRMLMIKNCAIEQFHLNHKIDQVRDAPAARMSGMLGGLDPDPQTADRINELLQSLALEPLPGTVVKGADD